MRKTAIVLLVAVVVLASFALVACGQLPPSVAFVSPAKTTYYVGETLDLTGSTVTVYEADGDVVNNVTMDMLDASTLPNMSTPGTYTVKGSYNEFEFSFSVEVKEIPASKYFVSPAKKVYPLGTNKLDLTGASVNIDGTTVEVTADMLDPSTLPNFNVAGDYNVKVTYQGNEFTFAVKVYSPIEIQADTSVKYVRGDDVSKYLQMREVAADGTATEWTALGQTDVTRCEIENGKLYVNVDMLIDNVAYGGEYVFEVDETAISVNQLLASTPDNQQTYVVNGIVIAIATVMDHDEVIIADKTTGDVIGVGGLAVSGKVSSRNLEIDVEVGDEVVLPVTLVTSTASSEAGKLYAKYLGGTFAYLSVVSKNNQKVLDYSNATVITNQTELKAFLGSASARLANVNTIVKLTGEMKFTLYASSRHARFWFGDANVKDLSGQKIDGVSPCFCDGSQLYTTGATFSEQVLGDANWANTSFTAPDVRHKNIYAMYIGGNGYYHEFVILRTEDVTDIAPQITNQTFTAPTATQYVLGDTLNLAGAQIVREYDIADSQTIPVTVDMLDANTIPTFTTAGTFTVTGSYEGFTFSFEVQISSRAVAGIVMEANPNKTTYTHRDGLATLDLTGGKIRINYTDGEYEVIDLDASMLPPTDEAWAIGTVNYTVTYYGCTTTLAITYENTAFTISQLLQKTPEVATEATTVYEVTGVVVKSVSVYAAAELLIKEKDSNVVIGVWSVGEAYVGKYNNLKLEKLNVGDEIVFEVTLEKAKSDTTSYGMQDKIFLRAANGGMANANMKLLSTGNSVNIALTDEDVTVITTQDQLRDFLASKTNYYKYVKFVGLRAIGSSKDNSGATVDDKNYDLFLGDSYAMKDLKVNNAVAKVSLHNVSNFKTYLTNASTKFNTSPSDTTNDFYMLYLGGNSKGHHFTILQSDWILPRA